MLLQHGVALQGDKLFDARKHVIEAIAMLADTEGPVSPCGACRQVLAEFCDENTKICLTNLHGNTEEWTMEQLLPGAFRATDLT